MHSVGIPKMNIVKGLFDSMSVAWYRRLLFCHTVAGLGLDYQTG